ncbi:hypothetical protein Sjap_022903 [Stephania japonica]|uniref:Calmodulin-binding domain-containing protein n=1 Tax=Stephania japonica TaxID=461633 RepID=A0AAP0EQ97_9MAGN
MREMEIDEAAPVRAVPGSHRSVEVKILDSSKFMATTIKDGSNAKEKSRPSSSSHQNIDSPRARRTTPKPLTADSADTKSTPNYLKHTKSSGKDVCIYGKNQASDDTNLKYSTSSRRKSTDPSPTQTSSKLKRTMSANPRVKPTTRRPSSVSSTPSTRPVGGSTTNKPGLDKTTKTLSRGGKAQPVLTRPMSIKKGTSSSTSATTKKEYRPKTSLTNKAPISKPDEQEIEIKHDEEMNTELEQDIEIEDVNKSNDHNDSLPTSSEEREVEPNTKKEEQIEDKGGQDNDEQEVDEKQGNVIEESSNAEEKQGVGEGRGGQWEPKIEIQGKNRDAEGNGGEAKPEQENVVLKRQDVQGKKETQAYNDVIEETASKLVEKRKSKVKALVGAFETVISLEND